VGPGAGLVGALTRKHTRELVDTELAGLKARAESAAH
jgi:hypothetical protein